MFYFNTHTSLRAASRILSTIGLFGAHTKENSSLFMVSLVELTNVLIQMPPTKRTNGGDGGQAKRMKTGQGNGLASKTESVLQDKGNCHFKTLVFF
jgi:hypothetical protein